MVHLGVFQPAVPGNAFSPGKSVMYCFPCTSYNWLAGVAFGASLVKSEQFSKHLICMHEGLNFELVIVLLA